MSTTSGRLCASTNVVEYGATGDGVTDDTAALQAAVEATAAGGTVTVPHGRYRLTRPLRVEQHCRLLGVGAFPSWGAASFDFNSINGPVRAPWVVGSVLVQTSAGEDAVVLAGAGQTVHVEGLAVLFDGEHRFRDTGHGFRAEPPRDGDGYDNGLSGAMWRNVVVIGHDGDHYALDIINGIYNDVTSFMSFGGGVVRLINDSVRHGHYGNANFASLYGQVFVEGSADGIRLESRTAFLNLLSFVRPQVTVNDMSTSAADYASYECAPATTAQQMLRTVGDVRNVSMLQFDFETGIGATITPPTLDAWMDPAGLAPTWLHRDR